MYQVEPQTEPAQAVMHMLADAMDEIIQTVYEQEAWAQIEDAIDRQIQYGLRLRTAVR